MMLLRAGPLVALLDGIDLRYVRFHGAEAFRRVYVAVRDADWATIPGVVSDLHVERRPQSFLASFVVDHRDRAIDYTWRGRIEGAGDGTITYHMDGTANASFAYNRIGFCVLHPDGECAGQQYSGDGAAGPIGGRLPEHVAPQSFENGLYLPLVAPFSSLTIGLRSGGSAHLECAGDLFEIEDQRNWTDASFKSYCTPMSLGFPHRTEDTQRFGQQVRLHVSGRTEPPAACDPEAMITLRIGGPTGRRLPAIGLGPTTTAKAPDSRQLELLRSLAPSHQRVEVHLDDPEWRAHAERLSELVRAVGCSVELAIFAGPDDDVGAVAHVFAGLPIARVLVLAAGAETATVAETTPASLVREASEQLAPVLSGTPVGGGTDMYFCELNRTRPDPTAMEFIAYSIMPQEHATDELSLVETLSAQAETVRSAQRFAGGRPIVVSPVTLLPRWPVPAADPRQASQFIGAWTAGSIKYLAEGGADAVSYYEPTGPRGVVTDSAASTPAYDTLHWAIAHAGAPMLECTSTDGHRVIGLALGDEHGLAEVLLANLTPERTECRLADVADGRIRLRSHAVVTIDPDGSVHEV
jgi:D-apionolactonase